MSKTELTKDEAYAVAEFIDMNIFTAIRSDEEWDSFQILRNLCHAYEKCCAVSGYVGVTDSAEGGRMILIEGMDKSENCMVCPLIDVDEDCILRKEESSGMETFDEQYARCPMKEVQE